MKIVLAISLILRLPIGFLLLLGGMGYNSYLDLPYSNTIPQTTNILLFIFELATLIFLSKRAAILLLISWIIFIASFVFGNNLDQLASELKISKQAAHDISSYRAVVNDYINTPSLLNSKTCKITEANEVDQEINSNFRDLTGLILIRVDCNGEQFQAFYLQSTTKDQLLNNFLREGVPFRPPLMWSSSSLRNNFHYLIDREVKITTFPSGSLNNKYTIITAIINEIKTEKGWEDIEIFLPTYLAKLRSFNSGPGIKDYLELLNNPDFPLVLQELDKLSSDSLKSKIWRFIITNFHGQITDIKIKGSGSRPSSLNYVYLESINNLNLKGSVLLPGPECKKAILDFDENLSPISNYPSLKNYLQKIEEGTLSCFAMIQDEKISYPILFKSQATNEYWSSFQSEG